MKKAIIIMLALMLLLGVAACGGGTKASAMAVSAAKQAVQVADDYLDGALDYSKATTKLDDLKFDAGSNAADVAISSDMVLLRGAILDDHFGKTAESYDKVIAKRNELAKDAGLKKR